MLVFLLLPSGFVTAERASPSRYTKSTFLAALAALARPRTSSWAFLPGRRSFLGRPLPLAIGRITHDDDNDDDGDVMMMTVM